MKAMNYTKFGYEAVNGNTVQQNLLSSGDIDSLIRFIECFNLSVKDILPALD